MQVKIKCPECKDTTNQNIDYKPAGRGSTFSTDGKTLQEQGFKTCSKCHAQFVYKLDVEIVCATSKLSF